MLWQWTCIWQKKYTSLSLDTTLDQDQQAVDRLGLAFRTMENQMTRKLYWLFILSWTCWRVSTYSKPYVNIVLYYLIALLIITRALKAARSFLSTVHIVDLLKRNWSSPYNKSEGWFSFLFTHSYRYSAVKVILEYIVLLKLCDMKKCLS